MRDESLPLLPPLAYPLSAADAAEPGHGSQAVAAFPEIGATWEGFCLTHLSLVGFRRELIEVPLAPDVAASSRQGRPLRRRITVQGTFERVYVHEDIAHWSLAGSLTGQVMRLYALDLWGALSALSQGKVYVSRRRRRKARGLSVPRSSGSRHLPVPLGIDPAGAAFAVDDLARTLASVHRRSLPVEEAFAIWSSLREAESNGWLSPATRREMEARARLHYQRRFRLRGFADLYVRFQAVADQAGFDAALAMALVALGTTAPEAALRELIGRVAELQRRGEAVKDADAVLELVTPAFKRRYGTADLEAEIRRLARLWSADGALTGFWHGQPSEAWYCGFDAHGLRFYGKPAEFASLPLLDWVWLEALRQQLTAGRGLRCPFWDGTACCGYGEQLDAVWRHTRQVAGTLAAWERQGCLRV